MSTVALTKSLASTVRSLPVAAAAASRPALHRSVGGIHSSGVQDHFWNPVTPLGHTAFTWTGGDSRSVSSSSAAPEEAPVEPAPVAAAAEPTSSADSASAPKKEKKQKQKQKQPKQQQKQAAPKSDQPVFSRFDFRVGHVLECKAVEASRSLVMSKIDVGEDEPRQIVSGLKAFYNPEDIQGTKLIAVCNLKPSKLMDNMSYGMVLCAKEDDTVEIIRPPADAKAGEPVLLEGEDYSDLPKDVDINAKKKNSAWAKIAPLLKTDDDLAATCEGKRMVVNGEPCVAASLKQAIVS